jgi:hypothetical protein
MSKLFSELTGISAMGEERPRIAFREVKQCFGQYLLQRVELCKAAGIYPFLLRQILSAYNLTTIKTMRVANAEPIDRKRIAIICNQWISHDWRTMDSNPAKPIQSLGMYKMSQYSPSSLLTFFAFPDFPPFFRRIRSAAAIPIEGRVIDMLIFQTATQTYCHRFRHRKVVKIDVIVLPSKARSARVRSNFQCLFLPHVLRTSQSQQITSIREFQSIMSPAGTLL